MGEIPCFHRLHGLPGQPHLKCGRLHRRVLCRLATDLRRILQVPQPFFGDGPVGFIWWVDGFTKKNDWFQFDWFHLMGLPRFIDLWVSFWLDMSWYIRNLNQRLDHRVFTIALPYGIFYRKRSGQIQHFIAFDWAMASSSRSIRNDRGYLN